jgi:hypothetical protein
MPYNILERHGKYAVENRNTHYLLAKGTTLGKAKAQMRLLYSKEPALKNNQKLIKKF